MSAIRYNYLRCSLMPRRSAIIILLMCAALLLPACSQVLPAVTPTSLPTSPVPGSQTGVDTPLPGQYKGALRFKNYGLAEGLSQSTITCMLQDGLGFMWFGSQDGLNRFDGYNFRVYTTVSDNPHSLSDRWITALTEDHEGNLWIGTRQGGLNLYTPSTGNFTHFRQEAGSPASLSSNTVLSLLEDRDGNLWVGTMEGLDKLNLRTSTFTHYFAQPDKPNTPGANAINAIVQAADGTIWVGTNGAGLASFDPETGDFYHYTHADNSAASISNNYVTYIATTPDGNLWVVTAMGLNLFDPATGKFGHYYHSPDRPNSISSNEISAVLVDHEGTVWIGTKNALDRLDHSTGVFKHYAHNPALSGSLSTNEVMSIYEDRSGTLWIGTFGGGVNRYDREQENFAFYHHNPDSPFSLGNDFVFSIFVEESGFAWIGTYGSGMDMFNPINEVFLHFRHSPADPTSLSNNYVWSIYRDRMGRLWVGTETGLDLYDDKTGKFTHYVHSNDNPQSITGGTVTRIFEDSKGQLWIGTSQGLNLLDPTTEVFNHLTAINDPTGITRDTVTSIAEDRQGFIWVGTFNKGLYRLDRTFYAFTFYQSNARVRGSLSNNSVLAIFQDSNARLWIGTAGGGLNEYNPSKDTFSALTEIDGLPSGVVYSILEDASGYLWMSTNNGISRFNPRTIAFKNYNENDGLQSSEFSMGAYAQGRDGAIYIGGVNGFNVFYPARMRDNTYIPPVVLTSLTQDSKPIPIQNTAEYIQRITLRYPQNYFEFEFTALSFSQPEKNQFAYMLEKFDNDWNLIGNKRYGRYTNLPGGNYILRLKAANNDGVWNETGASIMVKVIPPFWQTWLFRGMLVAFIGAGAFGIYQYRTNTIKRRNLELERLVKERTQEMEELFEKTKELAVIEERNRLARDLHDSAKQKAFAALAQIATANGTIKRDRAATTRHLKEAENLVYEVIQELTFLIQEMYPLALKEKGLEATLREYVFEWENRNDIRVNVQIKYPERLPLYKEQALYRIVQEALANIARHSCADRAEVRLTYYGSDVEVAVADDGCGFNPGMKFSGLGLRLIRERAESIGGTVSIESSSGKGTRIVVRLAGQKPLKEESMS